MELIIDATFWRCIKKVQKVFVFSFVVMHRDRFWWEAISFFCR
jgi:hypothetical protein